jgi:hypothetical protein
VAGVTNKKKNEKQTKRQLFHTACFDSDNPRLLNVAWLLRCQEVKLVNK